MEDLFDLHYQGIIGTVTFWAIILNLALPLCTAAFSIYWMSQISEKIWLKSVGSSLFVSNFFAFLLSIATVVFKILSQLHIKVIYDKMAFQLHIVFTILSLVVCSISLSLSNYSAADKAYLKIIDFILKNGYLQYVNDFVSDHSTFHAQKNYILKRTVTAHSILAGIFGTWISSFIIYFVLSHILKDKIGEQQPLLEPNDAIISPADTNEPHPKFESGHNSGENSENGNNDNGSADEPQPPNKE